MIDLYPAIDLLGGRCVRLYQGDYERETVYGDDPVAQAQYEEVLRQVQVARDAWALNQSIILLVCATAILAVSLWRPARMAVISNGLLLGGVPGVLPHGAGFQRPAAFPGRRARPRRALPV